jgi:uncharacterized coiled-coil protein SlyX
MSERMVFAVYIVFVVAFIAAVALLIQYEARDMNPQIQAILDAVTRLEAKQADQAAQISHLNEALATSQSDQAMLQTVLDRLTALAPPPPAQ